MRGSVRDQVSTMRPKTNLKKELSKCNRGRLKKAHKLNNTNTHWGIRKGTFRHLLRSRIEKKKQSQQAIHHEEK